MCGRFFVDAKDREIDRLIESLSPDAPPFRAGDVFPGNNALVLELRNGQAAPEVMNWGFPRWDGKGLIFNARSESALHKPIFRDALLTRPLLIPASGFYEWKGESGSKEKYLFTGQNPLLYIAGFWKEFVDDLGEARPCFTILTTEANDSVRPYHGRMPVLLAEDEIMPWLNGENRDKILSKQPFSLRAQRQ